METMTDATTNEVFLFKVMGINNNWLKVSAVMSCIRSWIGMNKLEHVEIIPVVGRLIFISTVLKL